MPITTILFDLDGTLLPMDQDIFIKAYFSRLAAKAAPRGYDPQQLIQSVWAGTAAMIRNNGSCTNEEAFWQVFAGIYGEAALADKPLFDEFYATDFQQVRSVCGFAPEAAQTIRQCKEAGFRVALATNPIFPQVATYSRIRWAGLDPTDFALITTYENACHCKPALDYYRDILSQLDCDPTQCLMVGNDVAEDMVARELGMQVFLLTDCLINKPNADLSQYPHGDFAALQEYLSAL